MSTTSADIAALLAVPPLETSAYPPTSRYFGHATRVTQGADGRAITHLAPRLPPDPASLEVVARHRVVEGDSLDAIAARTLGEALVAWRIADVNGARIPEALTDTPGRVLDVALPRGGELRLVLPGGATLQLFIGPAVPVSASREVVEALRSVTVSSGAEGPDAFQLEFDLSTRSPLHTLFLVSGGLSPIPIVRVVVAVTIDGVQEVLIDGVVANQEVIAGDTPGRAILSVTGEDLSRVMDYIDFSGIPYPAMPDFTRVLLILAKYAVLGIVPKVLPSPLVDVPIPVDRIPVHCGKDLGYVRMLAERAGYVFYVEPGPAIGVSQAYWGPKVKVGAAQPALSLDFDGRRNVERISFDYDTEKATLPIVFIQNLQSGVPIPIPVPNITPLSPPLAAVPAIPKQIEPITETAKYSPIQGALVGMAKAAQTAQVARARGELDVRRYGRLLKPRKLVGVRGAGVAFNGLWYVERTTSVMRRGAFTQSFELSRDGVVSSVGKVSA